MLNNFSKLKISSSAHQTSKTALRAVRGKGVWLLFPRLKITKLTNFLSTNKNLIRSQYYDSEGSPDDDSLHETDSQHTTRQLKRSQNTDKKTQTRQFTANKLSARKVTYTV
ncbi:hypothetical protein AVEN_171789-1 [Araneus ventricosus]|uniref:Uncharacterized protein n=1 Tax=Araneus ventricosus TaxID=182803 RepID=A0A4Y2G4N9_ARAVE|nr:hypothetical protein AVEN_171789-1 [Araneus ventricosus]